VALAAWWLVTSGLAYTAATVDLTVTVALYLAVLLNHVAGLAEDSVIATGTPGAASRASAAVAIGAHDEAAGSGGPFPDPGLDGVVAGGRNATRQREGQGAGPPPQPGSRDRPDIAHGTAKAAS